MTDLLLEPWKQPQSDTAKPVAASAQAPTPALQKAIEDRTDSLVIQRLALKKGITLTATPKLNGLSTAFGDFTKRVEAAADKLHQRMQSVGEFTETAVVKFGSAVDKIEAQAREIDDAANQMTNGGPPLEDSNKP